MQVLEYLVVSKDDSAPAGFSITLVGTYAQVKDGKLDNREGPRKLWFATVKKPEQFAQW